MRKLTHIYLFSHQPMHSLYNPYIYATTKQLKYSVGCPYLVLIVEAPKAN